jgi:hypothetical protein
MLRISPLCLAAALVAAALPLHAQEENALAKKTVRIYPYKLENQTNMSCVQVQFFDHNTGRGWTVSANHQCKQSLYCMIHVDILINNEIELSALRWAGILPRGRTYILQNGDPLAEAPQDKNFVKFLSGSYHCQPPARR